MSYSATRRAMRDAARLNVVRFESLGFAAACLAALFGALMTFSLFLLPSVLPAQAARACLTIGIAGFMLSVAFVAIFEAARQANEKLSRRR